MLIGVPKEIKVKEFRVGMTPTSVREVIHHGHKVIVETNAGAGIGMDDEAYTAAGAEMGDRALIDIAATLQEVLRADGLVARYGSDKFAILLPPEGDAKISIRLRDVAERARACVRTKTYHGIQMSASIGGVCYPGPRVESAPDLVALADDALAKARARGDGGVEITVEF